MAKLYVGNLPFDVTDDKLQEFFNGQGFEVQSARVVRDMGTGRSRGFGFVELGPNVDCGRAISQLNGVPMDGRPLQVNEARPQAPRGNGGRGGGFNRGGGGRGGHGGGRGTERDRDRDRDRGGRRR